jgi:flagellar basal body-associated protein FliL
MAKETAPTDSKGQQPPAAAATPAAESKKGFSLKKILMIGGPILLVQIVAVYFILTKFFAPAAAQDMHSKPAAEEKKASEEQTPQIVVVKDVIVNPAGTNGSHLLVTTIGLEVNTAEAKTELEQKEVQTRDILVTILTGKRMDELTTPDQNKILKSGPLNKVYISKFIIQ